MIVESNYLSTYAGKVLLLTPWTECLMKDLSPVLLLLLFLKITDDSGRGATNNLFFKVLDVHSLVCVGCEWVSL